MQFKTRMNYCYNFIKSICITLFIRLYYSKDDQLNLLNEFLLNKHYRVCFYRLKIKNFGLILIFKLCSNVQFHTFTKIQMYPDRKFLKTCNKALFYFNEL